MIPTQPEGKSTQFAENIVNNSPQGKINRLTPNATLQDVGYKYKDKVPYQYLNGILHNIHYWITWAKDSILDLDSRLNALTAIEDFEVIVAPEDWVSVSNNTKWEYRISDVAHGKSVTAGVWFQTLESGDLYKNAGADILVDVETAELVIRIEQLEGATGNIQSRIVVK